MLLMVHAHRVEGGYDSQTSITDLKDMVITLLRSGAALYVYDDKETPHDNSRFRLMFWYQPIF